MYVLRIKTAVSTHAVCHQYIDIAYVCMELLQYSHVPYYPAIVYRLNMLITLYVLNEP